MIITFKDFVIPVKVFKEWRSSVRYSIGKKNAILRMPKAYPHPMAKLEMQKFEQWVLSKIHTKEKIFERFRQKSYLTGDVLIVRDQQFVLDIKAADRKTNAGKIDGNKIQITLSHHVDQLNQPKVIEKLVERLLSKYFKREVVEKVNYFNEKYFQKEIESVKLKYNQSNWGSCSSKRNINLSSRLLLAPDDVLDYVIVHELSHLIEMNHSQKFWNIVSAVMPDYKEKEAWLNENGHMLVF